MSAWLIRAGRGGIYAQDWLDADIVGINWDFDGMDIASMSRDQIKTAYAAAHPGEKSGTVSSAAGQVYRFAHDVAIGDTVVMYNPLTRLYHLGIVQGTCTPESGSDDVTYVRETIWGTSASRDALTAASKNSLGSISTFFSVSDEVMSDIRQAASVDPEKAFSADADNVAETDEEARYATYEDGIERIKDKVLLLDWEGMEFLVAGLLRAMGYHARVTPKGPDGGRDVIASPDALGLESPRIVAEVKHRKGSMGAPEIRSFIGGLRNLSH